MTLAIAQESSSSRPLRRYQDLDGGTGRAIHFRPRRYAANELGMDLFARLSHAGAEHVCSVLDAASGGIAFVWRDARPLERGEAARLELSIAGELLYRGAVEVAWCREDPGASGVKLLEGELDMPRVLALRAAQLAAPTALATRPWDIAAHDSFKARVADLALLLAHTRRALDAVEPSVAREVLGGGQRSAVRRAFFERLGWFMDEFARCSAEINDCVQHVTGSDRARLGEYSRRLLHDFFMQAPWLKRALEKPRGYPGDFELMNGLYGERFVGNTLFAQALNAAFVSTPAGEAVRQRKNLIKSRLHERLDATSPSGQLLRIVSIAAGPAEEIHELLGERRALPCPVEIVLFEQDEEALAFAQARIQRVLRERPLPSVRVRYLHDSIKRLLRDRTLSAEWGPADVIFSCGLYDYLHPPTAAALTSSLFSSLAPGGHLYIGNMVPTNPGRWFMDFHLDWELLYKEPDALLAFARRGAPDATHTIVQEASGVNPFVMIERTRS